MKEGSGYRGKETGLNMEKRAVRVSNVILDLDTGDREDRTLRGPESNAEFAGPYYVDETIVPSHRVIEAVTNYVRRTGLNRSPDSENRQLRASLSDYTGLPPDHISCYAGANLALSHIFKTYLESGTEIVIVGPANPEIRTMARCTGSRVVDVPCGENFEIGIEEVVDRVTPRTRAIYIGNPNDLSGSMFGEAELVFLLAYAERTMIVLNEESFEFSRRTLADLVSRFPNLTIVRSLTRAFGLSSLNAAYIISDPRNLEFIHMIKGTGGVDALTETAAMAALGDIDHLKEYAVKLDQSKRALYAALPETGFEFRITPSNFMLLRVSNPLEAAGFLRREGFVGIDLSEYEGFENTLRINIGTRETTDRLILALSRLAGEFSTGLNRERISKRNLADSRSRVKRASRSNAPNR